jgi:hypothetical protein
MERANYFQNIANSVHQMNTINYHHPNQHHLLHHHSNPSSATNSLSPKSSNPYYSPTTSHQPIYVASGHLSPNGSSHLLPNSQQYFYNGGISSNIYLNTLNPKQQFSPQHQIPAKQSNESSSLSSSPPTPAYTNVYTTNMLPTQVNSNNSSLNEAYLVNQQNVYSTAQHKKANEF